MEHYSLQDAQNHLQKLIENAHHGKTVVILDDKDQAVQLVPVAMPTQERQAGSARGQVKMTDDFDAPLPDFSDYTT